MLEKNIFNKRIRVQELAVGMFISALDRPWLETPFLLEGFLVTDAKDIKTISALCKYVYIDLKKSQKDFVTPEQPPLKKHSISPSSQRYANKTPMPNYHKNVNFTNKHSIKDELENARHAYKDVKHTVTEVIEEFKAGRDINIEQAEIAVSKCVTSIFNNKDALLWFTLIKDRDHYTSQHSLNVSILSIAFGRYLGHPEDMLQVIGLCGLLHDVGKLKIPLAILNKEGTFTAEEYEVMKQHPEHGREYLSKLPNMLFEVIDSTYSHHEKMDGSGYPQGLDESQISYYAKLIAITDAYDAITSDRCYQNRRTTLQAQKILYESAGKHFDKELVKSFIQWLGIYPPGSIVEMTNGEIGIVLAANPTWKTKPRVIMLLDQEKAEQPHRIVDLFKNDLDDQEEKYRIKASHPNNTFGLDLNELHQKGILDTEAGI